MQRRTPRAEPRQKRMRWVGKGLKGKGKGMVRHQRREKDPIDYVSNGVIRRLCRRAGITRISSTVYVRVRRMIKNFVTVLMRIACLYCSHDRVITIKPIHVICALKNQGITFLGESTTNKKA